MARNIETIEHGTKALWLRLGRFFCDRTVIKEMSGPMYSAAGVTWFVALERGEVVGFCSLRATPTAYWHDYAYVVPESRGRGVFERLSAARTKHQSEFPALPSRVAIRKKRWQHYKRRGWRIDSERGSWIYASREPER